MDGASSSPNCSPPPPQRPFSREQQLRRTPSSYPVFVPSFGQSYPRIMAGSEAFVAGWAAGLVNLLVGHPFDTGKVRAQTGQTAAPTVSSLGTRSGFVSAVKFVYRGITGPVLTTG